MLDALPRKGQEIPQCFCRNGFIAFGYRLDKCAHHCLVGLRFAYSFCHQHEHSRLYIRILSGGLSLAIRGTRSTYESLRKSASSLI
jgi:hypothetical protein